MVCLEFRPIMGSVTTPLSLPLSKKVEERRQAVPTCPGCASPWTTCSPRSSWKQLWAYHNSLQIKTDKSDCEDWVYFSSFFTSICKSRKQMHVFFLRLKDLLFYSHNYYLKELKVKLKVVWVHGVNTVLSPLGGLQGVPTLRLRVTRLVAISTDHTDP